MSGNASYAKKSISYRQGIAAEAVISAAFQQYAPLVGRTPTPSSQHENKVLDVDEWFGDIPVSYKFMRSAEKYGSFTFELEVFHVSQFATDTYSFTDYRDGQEYNFTGTWKDSWYYNGKATYYGIMTESKAVYMVNKAALTRYVELDGWDKEVELGVAHRVAQIRMGHPHITTRLGVVSIKKLVERGVAWRVK